MVGCFHHQWQAAEPLVPGTLSPSTSPQPRTIRPWESSVPRGQAHVGSAPAPAWTRMWQAWGKRLCPHKLHPQPGCVPSGSHVVLYASVSPRNPPGAPLPQGTARRPAGREALFSEAAGPSGAQCCGLGVLLPGSRTLAPQRLRNKAWATSQGGAQHNPCFVPAASGPAQPPSCPVSEAAGPGQPCQPAGTAGARPRAECGQLGRPWPGS